MTDPNKLLASYARTGSEPAFRELVERYMDLVYSTAFRLVNGDTQSAQDVAQTVFLALAQKAKTLPPDVMLGGWLHQHTRFVAAQFRRGEQRRQSRERQAVEMNTIEHHDETNLAQLTPVLDEAIGELDTDDRNAILLRFFERYDFRQVGGALRTSEEAARKRVARALEKLHALLRHRGVTLSIAALGSALTINSVSAAPPGLAASVATGCLKAGGGVSLFSAALAVLRTKWLVAPVATAAAVAVAAALLSVHLELRKQVSQRRAAQVAQNQSTASTSNQATPPAPRQLPKPAPDGAPKTAAAVLPFQVLDADTGAPVPGAKIHAASFDSSGKGTTVHLTTDSQGMAQIPKPAPPYSGPNIFVTAENHVPTVTHWKGDPQTGIDTMRIAPATTISGILVDENQQPVPRAKIQFVSPGNDRNKKDNLQFGPDADETTDEAGRWSSTLIPRNTEVVKAMLIHPDFAPTLVSIPVKTGEAGNLMLQLRHGPTVKGEVVDNAGQPVAGAVVREIRDYGYPAASTKTDATGKFELGKLNAGDLMLGIQAAGLSAQVLTNTLTTNSLELKLVLQPGHVFRGRVIDESGYPITNATVQADVDNMGLRKLHWRADTDREGRFSWDGAPSEPVEYWFSAYQHETLRNIPLEADGSEHEITLKHWKVSARR